MMSENRIWSIKNEYFTPFKMNICRNAEYVISILKKISITSDQSIYLRGSFLESNELFPGSDIDIIVIDDKLENQVIYEIKSKLDFTNRNIEIVLLSQDQIKNRPSYRLLLHTRSLLVSGKIINFDPVKADLETMRDHLFQYKPFMVSQYLSKNKNIRIIQLKQITRAYGILYFLYQNKFSRDIKTCTLWAKEINHTAGNFLEEMWGKVDFTSSYENVDLSIIKTTFIEDSKRALDWYLKKLD
jgi:predicted nucleotidyltransferase